jgi:hypothetical protein
MGAAHPSRGQHTKTMQDEFIDDQPPVGTLTDEARASLAAAIADTPADHPDKVKHTPGPWQIDGSSICQQYGDRRVAWLTIPEQEKRQEWQANARLIAAAPCLLEALQDMVSDHEHISHSTLEFACAAIAKATAP